MEHDPDPRSAPTVYISSLPDHSAGAAPKARVPRRQQRRHTSRLAAGNGRHGGGARPRPRSASTVYVRSPPDHLAGAAHPKLASPVGSNGATARVWPLNRMSTTAERDPDPRSAPTVYVRSPPDHLAGAAHPKLASPVGSNGATARVWPLNRMSTTAERDPDPRSALTVYIQEPPRSPRRCRAPKARVPRRQQRRHGPRLAAKPNEYDGGA